MTNTEPIKGFRDFSGNDAWKRAEIKKILVETFEKYGFEPAETPVIEYEEFVRGDNEKDEAVSDVFKLSDKGKRKLALRYEFTFQLKRLMKNKKLSYKRYQIGEVFRDEPVSKNRMRQFTTCEVDIVGSTLRDDAEIISLLNDLLKKVGSENFVIYINNRKLLNEILSETGVNEKDRADVIREIDKLDKFPETQIRDNLKKFGAEKSLEILKKPEKYFEKYKSYDEIKKLKNYLELYGIKAVFMPTLARGLGYYSSSVFEVKTKKIKETICGGGAYVFNNVRSVGFGVSIERLSSISNIELEKEKIIVVSLNQDKEAINLVQKIRSKGNITSIYYGKPSKSLEYANAYGFDKVVFVGEKEVKTKKFKVKDMKTGRESILKF